MRCAVHGDSVNCPPFCTSQLQGTQAAGTPGGERITPELHLEQSSEARTEASENRTRIAADESKARDIATAFGDVGTARDAVRRALRELTDLMQAIEYIRERLNDCDALLVKYDAAPASTTTPA